MFKTNKENIAHLKAAIKEFGPQWFHGDGNVYSVENLSDDPNIMHPSEFRKGYSNPLPGGAASPASYRVKFITVDQVPDSVEELNQMLLRAANQEQIESMQEKTGVKMRVVGETNQAAAPEDASVKDKELEALRQELEALKESHKKVQAELDTANQLIDESTQK